MENTDTALFTIGESLLSGACEVSLDDKGRFAVPARFRSLLKAHCNGELTVTRSLSDRCLWIYPKPRWECVVRQLGCLPTITDPLCRAVQRTVLGNAVSVKTDTQYRLLVSPELRQQVFIERKAWLLGGSDKFELWADEQLQKQRLQDEKLLSDAMEHFDEHKALSELKL